MENLWWPLSYVIMSIHYCDNKNYIWATVKLGDTLAFFVKPCCSCQTNSTTTFIVLHVTALHTILNKWACTFHNNPCANYYLLAKYPSVGRVSAVVLRCH